MRKALINTDAILRCRLEHINCTHFFLKQSRSLQVAEVCASAVVMLDKPCPEVV